MLKASHGFDGSAFSRRRVARELVHQTTTPSQNGVWIWQGGGSALTRPEGTDQYADGNVMDNATLIPVASVTRVSPPPVQCRVATTANAERLFNLPASA